jgi:hypothetical protein
MLIRTFNGVVFERDWNRARIGAAYDSPHPVVRDTARTVEHLMPPACQSDEVVQKLFCAPKPPQLKTPQPVEANRHVERLEAFLNR